MRLNVSRSKITSEELLPLVTPSILPLVTSSVSHIEGIAIIDLPPYRKLESEIESLGASYTHIKSLKGIIGRSTKKVIMYHAMLGSLKGFEDCEKVEIVYLGFNRIEKFREIDGTLKCFDVLDLAGNPLSSLKWCPPCRQLIVSATRIENLEGCPEGVEIIRCGHSTFLKSLRGCPKSVILIECSCTPNLVIDHEDVKHVIEIIRED